MAYIQQDDKLQGGADQQQQPGQQSSGQVGSGSAPLVGSGSSSVGSNVSTAGVGAGGQGGWTNIQAYLDANKGNNTTVNALNNTVGGAFDQAESKINQSADQTKQQADQEKSQTYSKDNLDNQIKNGGGADSFKSWFGKSYSGPQNYAATVDQQAQQYGQNLQDPNARQALMNQVYNKAAGGQISSGALALQKQLDVNNPNLAATQDNLSQRYSALQNLASQKSQDTDAYVKQAQQDFSKSRQDADAHLRSRSQALFDKMEWLKNVTGDGSTGKPIDNTDALGYSYGSTDGNYYTPMANQYNLIQDYLGSGGGVPTQFQGTPVAPVDDGKTPVEYTDPFGGIKVAYKGSGGMVE
jgi:hypothetical protein